MRYVIVDGGVVVNAIMADAAFAAELALSHQAVIQHDTAGIGWAYSNGVLVDPYVPPADTRPSLVLTAATCTDVNAQIALPRMMFAAGATVAVTAELRDATNAIIPMTQSFAMPLVADDGRKRLLLVNMTSGVATVNATITESGKWEVREDAINSELPPEQQMQFAGLNMYVVQ